MIEKKIQLDIRKIWDKFRSGGLANPLVAIEQITYLLFMRRLEILDSQRKEHAIMKNEKHVSIFLKNDECRWSFWKNMSADKMLNHVSTVVFPFIKDLAHSKSSYSKFMKDATFIIQKPSLLEESVSILDEMNISSRAHDLQGDIYEYLLNELKISGKNDQFRTPRHIIRMVIDLVNPQLGETVCDPACGTGGFLVNSYEHIVKQNTTPELIKYDSNWAPYGIIGDKIIKKEHWRILKEKSFFGFDFDSTMLRIGVMNMMLHGIDEPNIEYADSLSKSFKQNKQYDVILANPPFAGSIDEGDINDDFSLETTKTSLLFLELFYNLLKIGGRAGIIIPLSELSTDSNAHKKIRKILVNNCQLEAIVTMPSGVFKPYAGVTTAVLIFTKGGKTKNVWYYEMHSDGYALNDKRDKIDGKGDIPKIIKLFERRQKSQQSFLISADAIRKNKYILNPNDYRKTKSTKIELDTPLDIIQEIHSIENELKTSLKKLEKNLKII